MENEQEIKPGNATKIMQLVIILIGAAALALGALSFLSGSDDSSYDDSYPADSSYETTQDSPF